VRSTKFLLVNWGYDLPLNTNLQTGFEPVGGRERATSNFSKLAEIAFNNYFYLRDSELFRASPILPSLNIFLLESWD